MLLIVFINATRYDDEIVCAFVYVLEITVNFHFVYTSPFALVFFHKTGFYIARNPWNKKQPLTGTFCHDSLGILQIFWLIFAVVAFWPGSLIIKSLINEYDLILVWEFIFIFQIPCMKEPDLGRNNCMTCYTGSAGLDYLFTHPFKWED